MADGCPCPLPRLIAVGIPPEPAAVPRLPEEPAIGDPKPPEDPYGLPPVPVHWFPGGACDPALPLPAIVVPVPPGPPPVPLVDEPDGFTSPFTQVPFPLASPARKPRMPLVGGAIALLIGIPPIGRGLVLSGETATRGAGGGVEAGREGVFVAIIHG